MAGIRPYTISVSETELEKLKTRLSLTTFPDELDESGWDYGVPLAEVRRLAAYWQNKFDWKQQETQLNKLPNYETTIQAEGFEPLAIHFLHQKSSVPSAIPLLFVHGWPGNFTEVKKLLPLLQGGDGNPAFHVVAPSIPNFGFSEGTKKKGFGLGEYAEVCHKLMLSLGYNEYVTQGGDWGYMITRTMSIRYPEHVKAAHINMIRAHPPSFLSNPLQALTHSLSSYTAFEQAGFERSQWYLDVSEGYRKQQSTKPQTLAYALADSPVGLLAWIYEKLVEWTDNYPWTDDEILTWVSIYWFSRAGPAANLRIYYEATHDTRFNRTRTHDHVPHVKLAVAMFPKELSIVPWAWARTCGPLVHESQWDRGGHFAATERPDAIATDLRRMFRKDGPCYGIVKGKDGF